MAWDYLFCQFQRFASRRSAIYNVSICIIELDDLVKNLKKENWFERVIACKKNNPINPF